jgi:16S rRNA (guanine527-N7)-methyltransferase
MELILKYFTDLTPEQVKQFSELEKLYKAWNLKINLVSRKDIDALYEKHVLHSLSIASVFKFSAGTEIIDIGTGGGFPGIPLAIFFPQVRLHLVDSIAKKIMVVRDIVKETGLTNVTTMQIRADDIKDRKFDFVVSRAVAPLKELWKWSKPLLRNRRAQVGNGQSAPDNYRDGNRQSPVRKPPLPTEALAKEDFTPHHPGLISLKGGELNKEIQESGTRPRIIEISQIFEEEYFKEKFILFVPL